MKEEQKILNLNAGSSNQRIRQAAEIVKKRRGIVVFDKILALRTTHNSLMCEVIDPTPDAHRCVNEYEVLVENAQKTLAGSELEQLLPDLPRRWSVVDKHGTGTRVLWHAP